MLRDNFFHIDNAADGHCAFYAFAIGLIAQIQNPIAGEALGRQVLRDLQCPIDEIEVKLAQIQTSLLQSPDRNLLTWLQVQLRGLLYRQAELECIAIGESIEQYMDLVSWESRVKNSFLYREFATLVQTIMHPTAVNLEAASNYNPLIKNDAVKILARKAALEIMAMQDHRDFQKLDSKEQESLRDRYLIAAFINDTLVETGQIYPESIILNAYQKASQSVIWGNDLDLLKLADILGIQILIWRDQIQTSPDESIDTSQPIIHLENWDQFHWVTLIPLPKHHQLKKDLQDYLPSVWFAWRYYTRHHNQWVIDLIAAIDRQEDSAIIDGMIEDYQQRNILNPQGALQQILDRYNQGNRENYSKSVIPA